LAIAFRIVVRQKLVAGEAVYFILGRKLRERKEPRTR
jgi:hypothetical protein